MAGLRGCQFPRGSDQVLENDGLKVGSWKASEIWATKRGDSEREYRKVQRRFQRRVWCRASVFYKTLLFVGDLQKRSVEGLVQTRMHG